jgi:hypothetical protein
MVDKIVFCSVSTLAILLTNGCNLRHDGAKKSPSINASSIAVITNNLGKTVELIGEPVGSKAYYGLKIKSFVIPIDSVWDPEVFDHRKRKNPTLLIQAEVDWEKGYTVTAIPKGIQTRNYIGEQIRDKYILRKVKVLKVFQ